MGQSAQARASGHRYRAIVVALIAVALAAVVAVASCSTGALDANYRESPPQPAPPVDDRVFAEEVCTATLYTRCVDGLLSLIDRESGALVVICDYGAGDGDLIVIDDQSEAEDACSGGGLIANSRVAHIVRLP